MRISWGTELNEPIIALIFDLDDTLSDDTTNLLLKEKLNMTANEIEEFWNKKVKRRVQQGWDPPLAYIDLLLKNMDDKNLKITNQELRDLGKKVKFYPGVADLFSRLKVFISSRKEFEDAHIQIEFYIISGGFEEIIRGSQINNDMNDIFGCTFHEENDRLLPKSIVTFTEKTKFLYAINKGISGGELRRNPYSVNDVISSEERRIAFSNMIYLGDGPTDIPCFSAVQQRGGKTIGILKYKKTRASNHGNMLVDKNRAWAIARGDRITLGPFQPNYNEDADLYINLRMEVERAGLEIYDKFKRRRGR